MRNYVIINGVNSLTIQGLAIKTMPPITKPIQRTLREEIDGRDGDIVTPLGYGAYDKTIEIGLFGTFDIDEVIAFFNQKGTITFSNEADKVYYFQALEQVDYAELLKFRTANVVLHCQPFKYPTEETPLVEEYEYVEATGTDITLDNTEETEFNEIELQGNTFQQTYTGKNLFDIATNTSDNYAVNNNISSISGNAMVLNGAGGASSRVIRLQNQVANKTYTASFNTDITTNRILVRIRKSDDSGWITNSDITWSGWTYNTTYSAWYYSANASNNKATFTFAVPSGLYWQLGIVNVNSTSATFSNIQLEEGSSATDFEPYVGGVPSPNTQFPQPVQVVSGDNEISICGKNRLKMPTTTQTYNNRTYAISSGSLKITGNSSAENTINLFTGQRQGAYGTGETITRDNSIFLKAGTYTLSFNATARVSWHYIIGQIGSVYDSSNQFNNIEGNYTKTFTITQDSYFTLSFYDYSTSGQVKEFTNMQLELGNATTYEPYNGETYPLYLGVENLLNIPNGTYSNHDVTAVVQDGIITLNGTANGTSYININLGNNVSVDGNYYTYSISNPTTSSIEARLFDTNNSYIVAYTTTANYKVTKNDTRTYNLLSIVTSNGVTLEDFVIKPQLEAGSKANSFSPYGTTPIEMASVQNTLTSPHIYYRDTFVRDVEGKWYKREAVGEKTLTGSEAWQVANTGTANWIYLTYLANFKPITTGGVSNYFPYVTIGGSDTNQGIFAVTDYVRVRWGTEDTIANYKTWLSTHNIILYWIKTTPTDIEVNETLANQLEAIWNATSYRTQTNITQVSNDLPFMMEVSALKLGSDHLEINNTGNIYSKPTIELEGTGIVDIYLNDVQVFEVDLSEENKITIDTEKMEAYTDTGLANRKVTGDYSTFKLNVGTNDLRFSGALTSATISRYIRWL